MVNAATPRLNKDERNQAVTILLTGDTQKEVATAFGVHQSTVERLNVCLHQLGSTDDRPRTGRPRVTTPWQDRQIRLHHLGNRFRNAVETAATIAGRGNQRISTQPVRNRLQGAEIHSRPPYIGYPLTPRRCQGGTIGLDDMTLEFGDDDNST